MISTYAPQVGWSDDWNEWKGFVLLSRIGGVGCANPSNLLKGLLSGVTCMNANAEKRGERYEEEYGEHGIWTRHEERLLELAVSS